ncbi:MAG: HIRAN domain-containing protein [Acetobacteraceae bacterium]|nr:HIRAN domain-containing protein [Acetobacteraceae bacterium]
MNAGLLALARLLAAGAPAPTPPPVRVLDFAVAGGGYHALGRFRGALAPGVVLPLRAEPLNPFDPNAVAVLSPCGGERLGYVPRLANEPVARLLALGRPLSTVVVGALDVGREADIPEDLAFTMFLDGDPHLRILLG